MLSLPVPRRLRPARAALLAIGSVAISMFARAPLYPLLGFSARFSTFYWAVFLSAWAGGFWPGILATLLSIGSVHFVLTDPLFKVINHEHDFSSTLMFAFTGTLTSLLFEALRNAHENSQESARDARIAREREKNLLKSIADGFIAFDRDWRITYVNETAAGVLGHPDRELLGKNIEDLYPNAVLCGSHQKMRQALEKGTAVHFEIHEEESDRWFGNSAYPSASGVSLFIRDVTPSRKLADAVRESEERFRIMADSAPLLIWTSSREGQRDYVNAAYLQMSGRDCTEEHGEGWMDLIHPDDRGRVRQAYDAARDGRLGLSVEYRMRRFDGEYRWMIDRGAPRVSSRGDFLGSVGSSLDITDRRHAEESLRENEAHLRLSMRASQTGTWHFDGQRKALHLSSELESILGLKNERARDADFALSIVHADDRERVASAIEALWEQGGERELECRVKRGDGKIRWLLLRGQGFSDASGDCVSVRGVGIDITDRKQFEGRFQHAQKLESLGILAGGIAHDFNNLLTGIMGSASIVMEDLEPGSASWQMQANALEAAERAAQLTAQMLAYSGKGRFSTERIDLGKLVRDNLRLLQASIHNKKVTLKLVDPVEPFVIEGDASQMQQVIMNLIINGAEAIPEDQAGTVRVRIGGRRAVDESTRPGPDALAVVQVQDSGIGMDEETMKRIFDPFFTTKFTGRGLGLAAVQGIVSGHQGEISVTSTPGLGTTFELVLRRVKNGNGTVAEPERTRAAAGSGTILFVDDEEMVRTAAVAALERAGYLTVAAEHGKRAVELFQASPERFCAIVLDMTMPVMSGEEALPVLKKIRPDIKIIVCSGYSETEAVERFSASGLDAFLQKPYSNAKLAQTVRELTETA